MCVLGGWYVHGLDVLWRYSMLTLVKLFCVVDYYQCFLSLSLSLSLSLLLPLSSTDVTSV